MAWRFNARLVLIGAQRHQKLGLTIGTNGRLAGSRSQIRESAPATGTMKVDAHWTTFLQSPIPLPQEELIVGDGIPYRAKAVSNPAINLQRRLILRRRDFGRLRVLLFHLGFAQDLNGIAG